MREERRAGLCWPAAAWQGVWRMLLLLFPCGALLTPCQGPQVWELVEEGVTEALGRHAFLCLVTASYCCGPQTTQGQRPRPESLSFL